MKAIFKDNIFRGYDIRAKFPDELNEAGAYVLGKAYATFLSRRRINQCVVVNDNRISSDCIKNAFIKGLLESGINVIDHGLGLVYFMYFSQYFNRSKGGAMITASHNPGDYNGFKLAVGFSDTMITQEIQELRQIAKTDRFVKPTRPGRLKTSSIVQAYTDDLLEKISERFKFKIVVDGGNCTPGKFLPDILRTFGCQVIEQNTKLDSHFPLGAPDPTDHDYLERLGQGVVKHGADLGFCYDADGDRIGIVDETGDLIWNDTLVAIFAQDILDYQPGAKIVFNTLCSKQVTDVIKARGGQPVVWLTGHSFIKAKIKEERALFGGELSGHFFFTDNFYGYDDGAYTSLRLLAYLSRVKKSLKQVVAELPQYISSPEIKIGCRDEIKFKFVSQTIGGALKKLYPRAEYLEIDGVRLDTKSEMVIVRPSQNGPYLTVKFEAKTKKRYDQLKSQISRILHRYKEVDFSYGVNVDALK
ncbi:phosphomannomutase/phosphoglucomutase [Patescibacteria group bacterium]|nr:phosphomannomutase/phosphoglucomutase [Patescibacteria group bacterium]MBU1931895.1 phosphomannomutase/phosphoglucomutase [Patescibacteria group bacterium]